MQAGAAEGEDARVCILGPPPKAEWAQTLNCFEDGVPYPQQTLTVKLLPETTQGKKSNKRKAGEASPQQAPAPSRTFDKTARTEVWRPLEPRGGGLEGRAVEVVRVGGSDVVILRDRGTGGNGAELAKGVEDAFGVDVLESRGPDNQCSMALQDKRITWDLGNRDSCSCFGDQHRKIHPHRFPRPGGNAKDCTETAAWCTPLFEASVVAANKHARDQGLAPYFPSIEPRSPERCCENCCCGWGHAKGSVKIVRYRCHGCKLAPVKRDPRSDMLHMHVDQDVNASTVMVLSMGDDAEMYFDGDDGCKRLAACASFIEAKCRWTPTSALPDKRAWRDCECGTCRVITLHSGDIVLFDGHPGKKIAHGVKDIHRKTVPGALPGWLKDCRVSLQYRKIN